MDNSAVARYLVDLYGFFVRELFITDNYELYRRYKQDFNRIFTILRSFSSHLAGVVHHACRGSSSRERELFITFQKASTHFPRLFFHVLFDE